MEDQIVCSNAFIKGCGSPGGDGSQLPKKKKRVGKYVGWKSQYKKAIVTLADGDTINLFAEN